MSRSIPSLLVMISAMMIPQLLQAEVVHRVPPGAGESAWSTPWKPDNVVGVPAFVGLEGLQERQVLGEIIPGVQFTTTEGQDWRVGRWSSGVYNGKYPNGAYTSEGDSWAWLGESQGTGIIRFTRGKATYFSCLASTLSGVTVDAYDADDQLVATSGWATDNLSTGTMDRVTVVSAFRNIEYVTIHDSGNYWLIDCISTDAPGVGHELAVPSFKQYDTAWGCETVVNAGFHCEATCGGCGPNLPQCSCDQAVAGTTVKQIGCAITSVAMVLASYGINSVDLGKDGASDVKPLSPGTLNAWLKSNNGYTASGDIYWNKVDVLTDGEVVFKGGGGVDYEVVNEELELRKPVLLKEPGHWVVARGKHTEDPDDESKNYFLIRDPGHAIDSLNHPRYNRGWQGYRRYEPGNGVVRPALTIRMHSPAELLIIDRDGRRTGFNAATGTFMNEIPEASVFEDDPINDLDTGVLVTQGVKVLYVPEGNGGPYKVFAIGTGIGPYEMEIEWRDISKRYHTSLIPGMTAPGKIAEYRVDVSTASVPLVTSKGSLQGGGTFVSGGQRVVIVANVKSDGNAPAGTLRFQFPGRAAVSNALTTATFQDGIANIAGSCTLGGASGYSFDLTSMTDGDGDSAFLKIMAPDESIVFQGSGQLNGRLRISN